MAKRDGRRGQERGAVAVTVGILSALVLFGMLGIAVDLSYLYVRRTELQNAADAAALSGAKKINQKLDGIQPAVDAAIATFSQNAGGNLIQGQAITAANIRFGPCPNASTPNPNVANPSWSPRSPSCQFLSRDEITSDGLAAGKTFIEVDTGTRSHAVLFMRVQNGPTTAGTFGYAVAGYFVNDVTPIAICAVDPTVGVGGTRINTLTNERLELGFRRGVSYNLMAINPLGGPADPYLVNPVDAPPAACDPGHNSANFTAPFVCTGSSAVVPTIGGYVYGNTGLSASIAASLNSRFDEFAPPSQCDPGSAPPDTNVREFTWRDPPAVDWMTASQQTMSLGFNVNCPNVLGETVLGHKPVYKCGTASPLVWTSPPPDASFGEYGVLWSYSRAYNGATDVPPFAANSATWQTLYNNGAPPPPVNYPASGSPYTTNVSPPVNPGLANRRRLNLIIVDCTSILTVSSCDRMFVLGVGRFFMQTKAVFSGGTKKLEAEFAGLITPGPLTEILLHR